MVTVTYQIALPLNTSLVHNIFPISMLREYELHPSHVLDYEPIELREDLTYEVEDLTYEPKIYIKKKEQKEEEEFS